MTEANQSDITALTVQLVSAFVSNNTVASDSLADLIKTTRAALTENPAAAVEETIAPTFTPAVSVRKSLSSREHIISLIDGKPYKTLKRHLAANNLTPEQYRERYSLPKSYPMVAQSYSESRRAVAAKIGLGKKPAAAVKPAPVLADAPKAAATPAPATVKKAAKAKNTTSKAAPVISNRATTSASPAAAKGEGRKRLGIAGPKTDNAKTKVNAASAAESAKTKPVEKKASAAPKAKSASKPKTLKAALEAAGSHLRTEAKPTEPASAKA